MTLRRPAAHLPMGWRRSGDETQWETLSSKGETLSHVSRRAARPLSAMEGREMDAWRQHFHRMQGDADRTLASCDKEPGGQIWRPYRSPSFSGVSSSYGIMTGSSLGSRESLESEFSPPMGRMGSLERVHISQTPKKEQSHLSYIAPVKTGWLPMQRRVMKVEDSLEQRQMVSPPSAVQVKLKQPITPTFLKSRGTVSLHQDGSAERTQRRTRWTPDRPSPVIKQVADKQRCAAKEPERPGIWQALRRGWNSNRLSGTRSGQRPTEIPVDPHRGSSPSRRTRPEEATRRTCAEDVRPDSVRRGDCGSNVPHFDPRREPIRVETSLLRSPEDQVPDPADRASGGSPATASSQPFRRHSLQPSHIQTTSAPTTLVPCNKVGFSSITISSRKVGRSASLTASDRRDDSLPAESMDPRKATIVKVTEQRTTVTHVAGSPKRKAAIIKVTEHKETYGPGTRYWNRNAKQNGTWERPDLEAVTTDPVPNGDLAPGEVPERPAVRKWSLGLPRENLPAATPEKDHQEPLAGRWSSTPCLTLIQTPDPEQSPEEVLALNAAAIIANIKLQRQLSKKKALSEGGSAAAAAAAPQGNTAAAAAAADEGQRAEVNCDLPDRDHPRAEPAPPAPDLQTSPQALSLQEALQRARPGFIARSQERVQKVERRARERRGRLGAGGPPTDAPRRNDNLLKSKEGGKRFISNRRTEEEKKKKKKKEEKEEAGLTNRQRVELFKKKLLDQILHRSTK